LQFWRGWIWDTMGPRSDRLKTGYNLKRRSAMSTSQGRKGSRSAMGSYRRQWPTEKWLGIAQSSAKAASWGCTPKCIRSIDCFSHLIIIYPTVHSLKRLILYPKPIEAITRWFERADWR
jgi:hypothetical protein